MGLQKVPDFGRQWKSHRLHSQVLQWFVSPRFSAPQDLVVGGGTQHTITVRTGACVAGFTFAAANSG